MFKISQEFPVPMLAPCQPLLGTGECNSYAVSLEIVL